MMRTKSLHRTDPREERRRTKQQKQKQQPKQRISTPQIGRSIGRSSWRGVSKWLAASPPVSPHEQEESSSTRRSAYYHDGSRLPQVSPPLRERQLLLPLHHQQQQQQQQTPAMTLVLRKLTDLLPKYCQAMASCEFVTCCSLLGDHVTTLSTASSSNNAAATATATLGKQASHPTSTSSSPLSFSSSPIFGMLGGTDAASSSSPSSVSSPSRMSPMRSWLLNRSGVSTYHEQEDSFSSLRMAEQERQVATAVLDSQMDVLFLLVGAESMYASMAHAIRSPLFGQVMAACYEQCIKDLQLLRLTLCDAFLTTTTNTHATATATANTEQEQQQEAMRAKNNQTVASLVASLLFLVSFCQARIQCLQLQSALWHSPPPDSGSDRMTTMPNLAEWAALFDSILPNLRAASLGQSNKTTTTSGATATATSSIAQAQSQSQKPSPLPAVKSLASTIMLEIGAWSALCQTAFAAQHCRFAESILGAQATKSKLLQLQKLNKNSNNKPPCLELWLRETLKGVIGTFPIVFDKVSAFCKPLYGFEEDMDVSPGAAAASTATSTGGAEDSSSLLATTAASSPVFRSNGAADAFESEVNEALQKYKTVGAVSIAVVVDAVRTSNTRVESGFCSIVLDHLPAASVATATVTEHAMTGNDPEAITRQQFPAVYMRTLSSSAAAASTPSSPGPPGSPRPIPSPVPSSPSNENMPGSGGGGLMQQVGRGMRRDSSRNSGRFRLLAGADDSSMLSSSPQLRIVGRKTWSNSNMHHDDSAGLGGASPTTNLLGRKTAKAINTLQYGTEEGGTSQWPHSEWSALVSILTSNNNMNNGNANTTANNDPPSSFYVSGLYRSQQTVYCVESLSDSTWLVAMMKSLEQPTSGWHWQSPIMRPTTETVEDDLCDLVSSLASMVRISDRFREPQAFREHFLERSSDEIGAGLADELKERGFVMETTAKSAGGNSSHNKLGEQGMFRLIKNQLKVLAQVNNNNNNDNSRNVGNSLPTRSRLLRRSRRGTKNRPTGHSESAAAFFLGPDFDSLF